MSTYSQILSHGVADEPRAGICPCCNAPGGELFYSLDGAPVHDVILIPDRQRARSFPSDRIRLRRCPQCGFIWNSAFQPELIDYAGDFEETQGYSGTFNTFHRALAERLIETWSIRDKTVLEIGCGKGEFLDLLCALGNNRGVGFDPGYAPGLSGKLSGSKAVFIQDYYSERHLDYSADLVCCKMTIEHIQRPAELLQVIRLAQQARPDSVIFLQAPNVTRLLEDCAFWDIYYEHCSYFSAGSLAALVRRCGFEVYEVREEYKGQYLTLEARPADSCVLDRRLDSDSLRASELLVRHFEQEAPRRIQSWRQSLLEAKRSGRRVVLWGGGSKAVAFLTTLDVGDAVDCVVDINPRKQGRYLPGSGHRVVGPQALQDVQPDSVIVMNSIYVEEVRRTLAELGLCAELAIPERAPARVG